MSQPPLSLDYIRQVVAEYFADKPVRRVEVFGSYARGEATAESDLDLLIELIHPVGWEWLRYSHELSAILGVKADIGTAVSDYIMRYIRQDLQTLYESQEKQAA
ncbi:MAG: nucleotidyltransferase [Cytophagaceae bacterium]|nr:MAG: nucleotidyltransferase [Cytophagaceae bacterium]